MNVLFTCLIFWSYTRRLLYLKQLITCHFKDQLNYIECIVVLYKKFITEQQIVKTIPKPIVFYDDIFRFCTSYNLFTTGGKQLGHLKKGDFNFFKLTGLLLISRH